MLRPATIVVLGLPTLFLLVATIVIRVQDLDLAWMTPHFDAEGKSWPTGATQPWKALYDFGYYPGWVLALGSGALVLAGFWKPSLRRHRKAGLFLFLLFAIGPGLIVNAVFKDHWGRPRPRDVEPFAGQYAFEEVWTRDPSSPGKSFPSGHASTGFYFVGLAFVLAAAARTVAAGLAAVAGVTYGTLLGIARMVQGGHFPSDVLWAFGMVFLTAVALYFALKLHRREDAPKPSQS